MFMFPKVSKNGYKYIFAFDAYCILKPENVHNPTAMQNIFKWSKQRINFSSPDMKEWKKICEKK